MCLLCFKGICTAEIWKKVISRMHFCFQIGLPILCSMLVGCVSISYILLLLHRINAIDIYHIVAGSGSLHCLHGLLYSGQENYCCVTLMTLQKMDALI